MTGHVDGAWWRRSDDLPSELPDLLAVLSVRLGSVERVMYNVSEWAKAPARFTTGTVSSTRWVQPPTSQHP
ncbi:MAG: hypothetical protein NVSMB60_28640 [Mycobacterium sp.]